MKTICAGVMVRKLAMLAILALMLASIQATAAEEESAVYTVTINYVIQNAGPTNALNVQASKIYLFDNVSGFAQQQILSENVALDGVLVTPTITEDADNRWFTLPLGNINNGQSKTITVTQVIKLTSVDFSVNPDSVGTTIPSELTVYTEPVDGLYESDDPGIQSLAQSLTENTDNPYYKAMQIFDWLLENMTYVRQTSEHGALYGFTNKSGDCTEYANLFVAMARSVGIPAKGIAGNAYLNLYNISAGPTDINETGHAWAIFYVPNYGWLPADGVWPLVVGSFGEIDYAHVVGAVTGGDGVVSDGVIRWPGPGGVSTNWSYQGTEPDVSSIVSGSISPEVLLDLTVAAGSTITDDIMTLTVEVKNLGQSIATDLTADVVLDPDLFELVSVKPTKDSLGSGETWNAELDVRVKENAYGAVNFVTPKVNYSSSYGGLTDTLVAQTQSTVNIGAKPASPSIDIPLDFIFNPIFLALVGVGVAVGVAVAVARRR